MPTPAKTLYLWFTLGFVLHSFGNDKPNIIVILADDLGYSDIGCFGGEIETPNLDRLAKNGLRYTNFYNTSKCWTTRASLLTGEYWQKVTVGNGLKPETTTIADRLKHADYRTYLSGKWHLDQNRHDDHSRNPLEFGFDTYFGNLRGAVSYFNPYSLMRGKASASDEIGEEFYLTDAISDDAQENIRNHVREHSESPFFLYLAYTAPHWPLHALPVDIAKYEAYYEGKSFDEIRRSRFEKMNSIGVLPQGTSFSEPSHRAWSDLNQSLNTRRMAVYAAMVDCMDRGIGQVIKALEDTGQLENTLICFMTDNGADSTKSIAHNNAVGCLGGEAITLDGHPISISGHEFPGDEATFQSYGPDWANVSNTPYRYFKLTSYEGGIRSPFILHWPAGIEASRRGTVDQEMISHLIDLSPSFLRLAGEPVPESMDGISVAQYWNGTKTGNPQRTLFNAFGRSSTMLEHPWKLVNHHANSHLFNIESDASETNDLAAFHQERLEAMKRKLAAWKSTLEK